MISIINAGIKTMLGDGSAGNPYQIRTAKQLYDFSVCVNAGNDCTNKYYIMTADIDLSGYSSGSGWTPIGVFASRFSGVFDGNGFSIYNLTVSGVPSCGLFGYIGATGILKNINLQSGTITGNGLNVYTAGICGRSDGTITGCVNRAGITGNNSGTGVSYAAGICALLTASTAIVTDCANFGTIAQNSASASTVRSGGIIGSTAGNTTIARNFNAGAVTGTGTIRAVAGVGTISNCFSFFVFVFIKSTIAFIPITKRGIKTDEKIIVIILPTSKVAKNSFIISPFTSISLT